jgi:Tol biopolymer transport system component
VKHAAVLALVLFLAACGSSGGSKPSSEAKNGPLAVAKVVGPDYGIYTRDLKGREHRLTETRGDDNPTWSPDGKRIAFTRAFNRDGDSHVFVVNADGSGLRQVGAVVVVFDGLSWSPDGTQIAFADQKGIAVVKTDGSGVKHVVSKGAEPAWSPDGDMIAYRHLPGEIWVVRSDGSDAHLLAKPGGSRYDLIWLRSPSWSHDGEHVTYVNAKFGELGIDRPAGTIDVIDKDGKNRRSVTSFYVGEGPAGAGVRPSWSPDDRFIVFFDLRPNYNDGVFVVPAEGGKPQARLDGPSYSSPSWGPAGT